MDQDWEWEDLLDDKPALKREPEKKTKPKTKAKAKAKPKGKPEAETKAKPKDKPEAETKVKPKDKPETEAEAKPEATSESEAEAKPEATSETEAEAKPESKPSGKKSGGSKKKRKKKRRRKKKSSRLFLICYAVFVLVLVVAAVLIVRNVRITMEEMHVNAPENFVRQSLKQLSDDDMLRLFETNPAYETQSEASANIRQIVESEALILKRLEHNAYEVYSGEKKLFEARLNASASVNKLGLINYDILESCAVTPIQGNELFHYEIKAPSTCEITVNGKPVGEPVSKETVDGFADADDFVDLPTVNTYVLEGLTAEPEILARNNGTDVPVTLSETIDLTTSAEAGHAFATTEEAGIAFDALEFARQWIMFNRNDLTGDLHGYYTIEQYLVPDSDMCTLAYQYATSQDIGWTSNHVLLDPPFTDETVSNVIKYDDNTASVDVALKMHMVLDRGAERTDSIHTTLYLIRLDDAWKVINTRDVENE